jgi:hypothetical protein
MGDLLEDDFDADGLINNYENYDDNDNFDDQSSGDEISGNEDQETIALKIVGTDLNQLQKKLKRKEKFNEMKLKKKQRMEDDCDGISLTTSSEISSTSSLTASEQYELCLTHCCGRPSQEFRLQVNHFLHLPSSSPLVPEANGEEVEKKKKKKQIKNPFVSAIETALPSFHSLLKTSSSPIPNTNTTTPGSPYVIILCAAAGRAADVINQISSQMKCKIGKLFAKHFKIQDQVEILHRQDFPIVVGTPNRISKLLELGALSLTETQLCLIDMELNMKSFSILTLPGVCQDFYQFLCSETLVSELNHLHVSLIHGGGSGVDQGGEISETKKKKFPQKQKKGKGPPKRVGFNKKKITV